MKYPVDGLSTSSSPAVNPSVRRYLEDHEERDSHLRRKIVDIATLKAEDPFTNFNVDKDHIITESKTLVETIIDAGRHHECIAVAVELQDENVFIDLFTYEHSSTDEFPYIESLAGEVEVDVSSVHHLVGATVDVVREDGRWVISQHYSEPAVEATITWKTFASPLLVSSLLVGVGIGVGVYTAYPIELTVGASVAASTLTYFFLLYVTLARIRDQPLPSFVQNIFTPDYTDGVGKLDDNSTLASVKSGEFIELTTLAPESKHDDRKTVLRNTAVVVSVPPEGEIKIPVPTPPNRWDGSVMKAFIYSLSPTIAQLNTAKGDLVPLQLDDGHIGLDMDRVSVPPPRRLTFMEQLADSYVRKINGILGVPSREELYR